MNKSQASTLIAWGGCIFATISCCLPLLFATSLRFVPGTETVVGWWRAIFGDPIFRLGAWVLVITRGEIASTIGLAAILNWLFFKILVLPSLWSMQNLDRQQVDFNQDERDIARTKLKIMFGEDLEKITFYENRLYQDTKAVAGKSSVWTGCGCLVPILLWLIQIPLPIGMLFNLAMLVSLEKLFTSTLSTSSILSAAGDLAPALQNFSSHPTVLRKR